MSVTRTIAARYAPEAPFVVAHRAGNDLGRLRLAERLGIPLIEADLHLGEREIEVRHLKTLGPVPVLWDRWTLASARAPRLGLETLLAAAAPDTELMLDLKGRDRRLATELVAALAAHGVGPGRRVTVCSQSWELLEPVAAALPDARIIHSVGSRRMLAGLRRRFAGRRLAGVSIHCKLLNEGVVADLRERAEIVMTWPVETPAQARTLAAWGVHGLITDAFESVAPVPAQPAAA